MKSRTVLLTGSGCVELAVVDVREPGPGEVTVRVLAAGICGTDVRTRELRRAAPDGAPPLAIGHEIAGVVTASRAPDWPPGTRVVVNPAVACGQCRPCRSGRANLCSRLSLIGETYGAGGLADLITVPERSLHRLPDGLDQVAAALVEPLSCARRAIRRGRDVLGGTFADVLAAGPPVVLGAGALGLGLAGLLRAHGFADVVVVEPAPVRRRHAARHGVTAVAGPGGLRAPFVLDASGSSAGFSDAVGIATKGAVVVVVSQPSGWLRVPAELVYGRELTLVWSLGARSEDFEDVLSLAAQGAIPAPSYVRSVPLSTVDDALFDALAGGRIARTVVRPDDA